MFRTTLLITTLTLIACGAKKAPSTSAGANAPAEESIEGAKIPDDKTSKSFAQKLIKFNVKDFKPADSGGARFVYTSVDFKPDNRWLAMAEMTADGETVQCKEEGTWEMDAAADEHTAPMTWKMTRSSCAGRPDTSILRVKVEIKEGQYRIAVR